MYSSDIDLLVNELRAVRVANDAPVMKAYMKGHFEYIGVKSQSRKEVSKEFIAHWLQEKELKTELVNALWSSEYRECQYVAMDYLTRTKRYWAPEHLELIKSLILTKSWWDTVDFLASTCVGGLLQKFPDHIPELDSWNSSDNMWLVRTTIIYQLKYKNEVDVNLLSRNILAHVSSKEFFIQKAIGWSLRQYAKYNADWVIDFVANHPLANLSRREALKHLG